MDLTRLKETLEQLKVRERRATLRLRYAQTLKEREEAQRMLTYAQGAVREAQSKLNELERQVERR